MAQISSRKTILVAFFLWLSSWAVIQMGVSFGKSHIEPGDGLTQARAVSGQDLFRFDSLYYRDIADSGYAYNGDPNSSPNLVFAPLFPLLTRGFAALTTLDFVTAGFYINRILFFFAAVFLLLYLSEVIGERRAIGAAFALVTAAGAYSFHAYYSESAMIFFLSLCLLSYQRRWWLMLALSSAFLGASRVAAAPIAGVFALMFLRQAWGQVINPKAFAQKIGLALVSVCGVAAYLAYVNWNFGDPFTLFPAIQSASWGLFHPPAEWAKLLTFAYLAEYWMAFFERSFDFADIRTLNLVWMSLAWISCVYLLMAWRRNILLYVFLPYFLFVYAGDASSEYLISSHRFFTLMIPIFIMGTALHDWLARKLDPLAALVVSAGLLAMNAFYGAFMAAQFNQGIWYYF